MDRKQEERFVEFYEWLYWTDHSQIPCIFNDEEEMHINMRKIELEKILGKTRYNKTYYPSLKRKMKYWEYAFMWLWLQYWPRVLDYNETINARWNKWTT